jgi:hypothetical protein
MINETPRKTAFINGLKRYEGRACLHGHGTIRFVASGDCVVCRNTAKNIAAQQKRAARGLLKVGRKRKYPVFVGPPKPKRIVFIPITEQEKWIARSKNNNNAKLRKELSIEYYKSILVTHCPLLGLELTYANCAGNNTPQNYATLDKINPTKGYVPGNVQILSYRANTLKNSATLDELKLIVQNWEKQL